MRVLAPILIFAATLVACPAAGAARLTVYASLPFAGDSRRQSQSVADAAKLALSEAGSRAGEHEVVLKVLNDATAATGKWEPGAVARNARKAAVDATAIAYLGEFNSGATAISLPILNQVPLLQVSPSNTAAGLTREEPGFEAGEPDMYYPSGIRTYARVVPADHIQARALAVYQQQEGCRRVAIVDDGEVYGRSLALMTADRLRAAKVRVTGRFTVGYSSSSRPRVVRRVRAGRPDCVLYGGITQNGAVALFKALNRALPSAKLFGPDGVAESLFSRNIGDRVARRTFITNPTLAPGEYPDAAQDFYASYRAVYGDKLEPYAIYGYEGMRSILAAIEAAGTQGSDRAAVIAAYFAAPERDSVLGRYRIDANGDTTLAAYGGNRVNQQGRLVYDRTVTW